MNFFDNIILKKNILGNASLIESHTSFHIAFGIDANFTIGTGVLIYSMLEHNSSNIVCHIFSDKIYETDISRLRNLAMHKNICIIIYYVNPKNFSNLPTFFTWSQAMYYRFLITECLNPLNLNILYLDSDILCLNNIQKLFSINLKNYIAAVIADNPIMVDYAKNNFMFKNTYYFNSGVMLINTINWKKYSISKQAINLLTEKSTFKFYDQDVLNILLIDKTILLDKKYNTIYHLADMKNDIANNTVFLHYSGSVKPWQSWGQYHFLTSLWLKYKNNSPWNNATIIQPKTYKQAKFMARTLKRNNKFISAIYWYIKYSVWKIYSKINNSEV